MTIQTEADVDRCLTLAMDIGERMMCVGAEVNRVEETIRRICLSFGAKRVDALSITSSLVVTLSSKYGTCTQTRRIVGTHYDLHRLEELNSLSRHICDYNCTFDEIEAQIKSIDRTRVYPFWEMLLFYAVISSSFSLFFGGSWLDAVSSGCIGIVIKVLQFLLERSKIGKIFATFLCSFFGGVMAYGLVSIGFGNSVDMINIGNIMLLIPGVAITGAVREMFRGDLITGCLRFVEALLLAAVIGGGFVLASLLF